MKKFIFLFLLFAIFALPVFSVSSEPMPWEDGLTKIMNSLSGPTAKIIGIILIVGGGIAVAVTEGQAVKKLLWVIVGIGIALNAASFMSMLFGNASGAVFISRTHLFSFMVA